MHQLDWNATIDSIRETVPKAQFQNWIKPLRLIRCDNNSVVVGVPNRFHQEWLKNNYAQHLSKAIRKQTGEELQLEFEIVILDENVEASQSQPSDAPAPVKKPNLRIIEGNPHPESAPLPAEPTIKPPNLPAINDAFIEMKYNHVAKQCCQMFIQGGNVPVNPLILLGGVGMGKTHLLVEIGKQMFQTNPKLRIRYVNFDTFTNEVVQSIKTDQNQAFRQKYRVDTDVLLFDDIQGLTKRKRSQEELLHIFNEILTRNGKIAFTCNIAPHQLKDFIEPLRSRLLSGVIAEIQYPDYAQRVELLKKKCVQSSMQIEDQVLRSLAGKGQKDIRELVGSLIRLHLQATIENREIDQDYVAQKSWTQEAQKEAITLDQIVSMVEHNFGVNRTELISKSRKSLVTWARQVAMYLARHYTLLPLEEIGKTFGRDHATVIHAFQKVKETIEKNPTRRYEVEFLKAKLGSQEPQNPAE